MTAQLRSELRKLRTTRTNAGLLLGMVALVLFGVIAGAFSSEAELGLVKNQRLLAGNGSFAAAFAAMVGVMAVTSEFRHGTIRATFVFTPSRARVVAAKVVASLLAGLAFGALGASLALGAGVAMIRVRGHDVLLDGGDIRTMLVGTTLMAGLWAATGAGLGALVRNQVLAIVGLFVWVFVAESLLISLLPGIGRYAPGAAGTALTGAPLGDPSTELLSAPAGGALLAAYAVALALAGGVMVARRDVI